MYDKSHNKYFAVVVEKIVSIHLGILHTPAIVKYVPLFIKYNLAPEPEKVTYGFEIMRLPRLWLWLRSTVLTYVV